MKEALDGKNSREWKEALDAEYSSLINNETWELVSPPLDANIVGSKWGSEGQTRCKRQHQPLQSKTRRIGIFPDTRNRL